MLCADVCAAAGFAARGLGPCLASVAASLDAEDPVLVPGIKETDDIDVLPLVAGRC